eukprot:scaffold1771_cov172-Amphora_coffeaeformis.AAC.9
MNFFWGDSQGKRGEDADAVVQTSSTFDFLSLPTSDAGTFYETLNKEIEGLRATVDSQLRDMVEASRRDITVLETKLKEIQGGESTISTTMKYDSSSQLYSNDSNITEPVANLSSTARDRVKDGNLSPSEEARLIGVVKIGPVSEGREDDENDENEATCQTHPQDRILQTRTSPDQSEDRNITSMWNPCSKHGLALMDNEDSWNAPTVKRKESKVDAIDRARRARYTPTSRSLNTFKEDDHRLYDSSAIPDSYDATIEKPEKLNTIRNQRSLIDAESEDGMSEYGKANDNTKDSLLLRGEESPEVPTLVDSLEDAVLRKRQSDDPQNLESNTETASLDYTLDDTVDGYISKYMTAQKSEPKTSNLTLDTKPDQTSQQLAPLSPEMRRGLKNVCRGAEDPPIDKKKVPSNPFYAMRFRSQREVLEKVPAIENVRSQSLTPTAMMKPSNSHLVLSSPQSDRPDSAPPIASSISLARMNHGSVSEDEVEHIVEDSVDEKPFGPGRRVKNAVKRFLSPSKKKNSQAVIGQDSRSTESGKLGDVRSTSRSNSRDKRNIRGSVKDTQEEEDYHHNTRDDREHDICASTSSDPHVENYRRHIKKDLSRIKVQGGRHSASRSRDAIDDYYERNESVPSNESFEDRNTSGEQKLDHGLLYPAHYRDSHDDGQERKQSGRKSSISAKKSRREGDEKSFGDLFVRHHENLTGEKHSKQGEASNKRSNRTVKAPMKSRGESHDYDTLGSSRGSNEFQFGKSGSSSENENDFVQHPSASNDDDYNAEVSSALVEWIPPKDIPKTSPKAQMKKIDRRQPSPEKLMRTRTIIVERSSQEDHKGGRIFSEPSHPKGMDGGNVNKEKRKKKANNNLSVETEQPSSFCRAIVPHVGEKVVAVPRANYKNLPVTTTADVVTKANHKNFPVITGTDLVAIQKTVQNGKMVILSEVQGKLIKDPYGDEGRYTGIMLDGLPHGEGIMHYSDGRSYTGEWLYGRWHGQGRALFVNGDLYVGKYERDRRHGKGRYEWSDGRVYDGEFVRNQRQGHGSYTWPDGASYVGEFVDGQRHGEGCYRFADGSVYKGEWKNGKYDGIGECVWASGRKYHGEWQAGQAQGFGVEFRSDGTIRHEGEWKKDRPVRRKKDPHGIKPSAETHRRRQKA